MTRIAITKWAQGILQGLVKNPTLCVDATCGTGQDTVFLCELCQEQGTVLAMDIQQLAIEKTKARLEQCGYREKVRLVCDSHANMQKYVKENSVDLIMFNLGYLPGGDHNVATQPEVTIEAIEKGLPLLKDGGVMSILIYSGGDSGFSERDALLTYLKNLDAKQYTVIIDAFYNKPNNPPIPVYIIK